MPGRINWDYELIAERVVASGKYIVQTKCTVRVAAKKFGIGKSTIHKDVTERLEDISPELHQQVLDVLAINKAERHIRGGEATKAKFFNIHGKSRARRRRKAATP